jgi:hypothetical protein
MACARKFDIVWCGLCVRWLMVGQGRLSTPPGSTLKTCSRLRNNSPRLPPHSDITLFALVAQVLVLVGTPGNKRSVDDQFGGMGMSMEGAETYQFWRSREIYSSCN